MKYLTQFNQWFDDLREPHRFWFFLIILMGWLPLMFSSSKALWSIGTVWLSITCIFAISRLR